jgi:hypothetical protein
LRKSLFQVLGNCRRLGQRKVIVYQRRHSPRQRSGRVVGCVIRVARCAPRGLSPARISHVTSEQTAWRRLGANRAETKPDGKILRRRCATMQHGYRRQQ